MKFGLIIPDSKKKQDTSTNSNKVASIFNEADDSEEEELAELRKVKSQVTVSTSILASDQFVTKIHEEALNEDPNVFDYDAALETESTGLKNSHRNSRFYNVMSNKSQEPETDSKEPKYMHNILAKAEERKIESELIKLRNMKRLAANKDTGGEEDSEVFVTSAYRQRLQELEEKERDLKERQKNEEDGDVTRRKDMSGFYYNLMKRNVSFGGNKLAGNEVKKVKTDFNVAETRSDITEITNVSDKDPVVDSITYTSSTSSTVDTANTAETETPVVFGPKRPPIKK